MRATFLTLLVCAAAPGLVAAAPPCRPAVESPRPGSGAAVFRAHPTAFEPCDVEEADYQRVLRDWLSSQAADAATLTSVSLGRAVQYPWLSRAMTDAALRDKAWLAQAAQAGPVRRDRLLAALLRDPALLQRLGAPFEGTRYELTGVVTYEKVLWRKEDGVDAPFDAQLWLRVRPRP